MEPNGGFCVPSVYAASQDLLRCAGDAWLEGASSSSEDDDADEDYGARRRATGARASTRSGRRRSGGARPAAAAQRSRVTPWLALAAERLPVCASKKKTMRSDVCGGLPSARGHCCHLHRLPVCVYDEQSRQARF